MAESTSRKRSPEYMAWAQMKLRCLNPKSPKYPRYGGRGISVCSAWLEFDAFIADMGARPSPDHSIDRIDNDGDYEPSNCRWATRTQQQRNREANRRLTHDGETATLAEWAERLGISTATLYSRVGRLGWSVEKALTTPRLNQGRRDLA